MRGYPRYTAGLRIGRSRVPHFRTSSAEPSVRCYTRWVPVRSAAPHHTRFVIKWRVHCALQPQCVPSTPAPPASPTRQLYETPHTPESEARPSHRDKVLMLSPASLQRLDKEELIGLIGSLRASVRASAASEPQHPPASAGTGTVGPTPASAGSGQRVTQLQKLVPGGLEVRTTPTRSKARNGRAHGSRSSHATRARRAPAVATSPAERHAARKSRARSAAARAWEADAAAR
jgi:hypothetical protein